MYPLPGFSPPFISLPSTQSLNQSYSASRMLSILVTRSWRLLECIFSFSMYVSFLSLPATRRSASTEDFRTSSLTWPSSFWISLTLQGKK